MEVSRLLRCPIPRTKTNMAISGELWLPYCCCRHGAKKEANPTPEITLVTCAFPGQNFKFDSKIYHTRLIAPAISRKVHFSF